MAQLPKPIDDQHVLISLIFPAVDIDELAYLDFQTFYNYLAENVKRELEKTPEETALVDALRKVKKNLLD